MGLGSALAAAASGLRVTQAGIDVVAQNVANAGSAGYTRRVLGPVQAVAADDTTGVRAGTVERVLDAAAQRQLRLETAGAGYTSYTAAILAQVDALLGQPGAAGSLDGALNDLTGVLQALAADPGSATVRNAALGAASSLAAILADVAQGVQALRADAETKLASDVARADELLAGIADLNGKIAGAGPLKAALLDERDRLVDELAGLMDVQASTDADGLMRVTIGSGFSLVTNGGAVRLSFDQRGEIGAAALYSAHPALRGVGTITATGPSGLGTDLVAAGVLRSGETAAALHLRDTLLPQAQRQLDELAAGLSRALSDREAPVAPATSGGSSGFDIDLTGLQAGNEIVLDYADASGAPRRIVLVPTLGGAGAIDPDATVHPGATVRAIDISGGPATLAARIGAALGAGFSVTAGPGSPAGVRILDDGSPGSPDLLGVRAGITQTGLTGGLELPVFVDAGFRNTPFTGSFEGGSRLAGLAQRLVVNPDLQADPSRLVLFGAGIAQGDPARPRFLAGALTGAARTFAAAGIGGAHGSIGLTVAAYARSLIEGQGAGAETAARLDEGQQIALATAQSRLAADSAVNIDQEMAKLIELQTAYGANARLITAVKDMLDTLMRI